jgi:hypothetical protein
MLQYNETEARLEVIYRLMNGETFGMRTAERLVGGHTRLMRLIEEGRIRAEKVNGTARNGKWFCNAADVLRNARIV